MQNMSSFLLIFFAILAGAFVPFQAGSNATLGRMLGHPLWATLVSLVISIAIIIPVMMAFKVSLPTFSETTKGPWWIWVGGAAGVVYITAALLLAPKLGATSFIIAVIAGQMIASLLIDHFGLVGLMPKPLNLLRISGVVMILAGLVITQLGNQPSRITSSPEKSTLLR
ncbi:DMT family transporter [Thalassospira sp. SN3W]|uniref:DMT family transporter n=1 Tax=Thalassospira sp. SN3W TaxID=3035476 RepID=UPI00311B0AB5